ncbi:MAG TPA: glutaredoxin domain-containing protein [Candidatus Saccharimonadales bacterium]|nr:glutaredoxin domain-containing protein [Candidatus Saccharimonadales bacterium]
MDEVSQTTQNQTPQNQPTQIKNEPKVILYSTTWCAFCRTEEQYFQKLGVEYIKKDVEEDKAAYEELMEKIGGAFQGVPVTDIAGDIVLGFDRARIDAALKNKSLVAA